MKKQKEMSFASRMAKRLLLWLIIIMVSITILSFTLMGFVKKGFYASSYHNNMLATREYVQRVLSDVYVAVRSTEFHLEQGLDRPDQMPKAMEYIVKENTRIRSCGISFIDNYYPQKGRWYCPYAWQTEDGTVMTKENLGDIDHDYLDDAWFNNIIRNDSAIWRDPFFDGQDAHEGLFSFLTPIHNDQGRPVAVLGADVSLGWLTDKLDETDSANSQKGVFSSIANSLGSMSQTYVISHDGTFITHPETSFILKDNLFSHIIKSEGHDVNLLMSSILKGETSSDETMKAYYVNGHKSYLFYAPIKHTEWMLITVVPAVAIETSSYMLNLIGLALICLAMLTMVVVCFFATKRASKPLVALTKATDEAAKGNFNVPLPIIMQNDEIRQLRDSIETMQHSLSSYIQTQKIKKQPDNANEEEQSIE